MKQKDNLIKAGYDVPVINYSVVNCKKEKRHDSVADGQLCGCPSQDVITQLHHSGAQEVMTN